MAFNGNLLTVGSYVIGGDTLKYIDYSKYTVIQNVQDLDSYRDANGVLHRNALDHIPLKIELETRPNLTNADILEFFGNIRSNFIVEKERKASVTAYVPEIDDYITQTMYMPDPQFKIRKIQGGKIFYESIRFAFIGY